jgi:hypothetical protein
VKIVEKVLADRSNGLWFFSFVDSSNIPFQMTITRLGMPVVIGATTLPKILKGVLRNSGEKKKRRPSVIGGLRLKA